MLDRLDRVGKLRKPSTLPPSLELDPTGPGSENSNVTLTAYGQKLLALDIPIVQISCRPPDSRLRRCQSTPPTGRVLDDPILAPVVVRARTDPVDVGPECNAVW